MSVAWIAIALLAAATVAIKAAGPLLVGGRSLPPRLDAVVALLAPSLLAALVVVDTFAGEGRALSVDERAVGLAAAALALAARLPMVAVMVVAAGVTAGLRAIA
jgi:branched-subunit amino acid transport protein